MEFLHCASKPIKRLYNVKQSTRSNTVFPFGGNRKPKGLWLSVGHEWEEWCKNDDFYTFNPYNYWIHTYRLKSSAKIYYISSFRDLEVFCRTYITNGYTPDWNKLSQKYDGIAFLNYKQVDEFTSEYYPCDSIFSWFGGIDVSCICVWNTQILSQVSCRRTIKIRKQ